MIKTSRLKAGGAAVGFGGLQTQPDPLDGGAFIGAKALTVEQGRSVATAAQSVSSIASAAAQGAVLFGSKGAVVLGSQGSETQGTSVQSTHDIWSGAAHSKRRMRPMEQLTGLAHDRPEIVAVMPFQPAFFDAPKAGKLELFGQSVAVKADRMTPVGRFIDAQRHVRRLRRITATRVVASAARASEPLRVEILRRKTNVESELDALSDAIAFMLNTVRAMVKLRGQLDLRDDVHKVDPQQVFAQHVVPLRTQAVRSALDSAIKALGTYAPSAYSVVDMMQRLGYDRQTVQDTFSSTKLWLQCMHDLREMLRDHSLEFADLPDTQRQHDRSPFIVGRLAGARYFRVSSELTQLPSLEKIGEEKELAGFSKVIAQIDQGFRSLYEGTHFGSEESRMAALVHLVSKEHRYSMGLSQPDVRRVLRDQFGFEPVDGQDNSAVFDAVIGLPGTSATDMTDQFEGSLAALAHRRVDQDLAVMTFESRYLDAGSDTFTPGSAYHVDGIMDVGPDGFATTRLDELSRTLGTALDRFTRIMVGMDMLSSGRPLDDPASLDAGSAGNTTSNPLALFEATVGRIVDTKSGRPQPVVTNDPISVVYAHAHKDTRLRALLFLLTLARLSQVPGGGLMPAFEQQFSVEKSKVIDHFTKMIVGRLRNKLPTVNAAIVAPGVLDSSIAVESLKDALRAGSPAVIMVDAMIASLLHVFVVKNRGLKDGRTRYGGVQDTVLLMVVFDLMCAAMHTYSGRKIVGETQFLPGTQFAADCFVINAEKGVTRLESVAQIRSRLQREVALVGQLVCTVTAVMANLLSSTLKLSDHLRSPGSKAALARITAAVGNNERLKALFTEQQVMMLGATVADIIDLARRKNPDADGSGNLNDDEEIRFMDEAESTPQAAAEVEAAFSDPEFTLSKGYNKRIITVGLPHGIAERLRQVVDTRSMKPGAFRTRQADMVRIVIYKVDAQMGDLVFKPLSFLFELSRFPVRDTGKHLPLRAGATLRDVISCMPTRDFGSSTGATLTYPDPRDLGVPGSTARELTFADPDHAFLTRAERRELLKNHALSHLLCAYIRLLTGVSLADHHFDLDEPPAALAPAFLTQVLTARAGHVDTVLRFRTHAGARADDAVDLFSSHRGRLQPRAQKNASNAAPAARALDDMDPDAKTVTLHDARTLSGLTRELTTMSDPLMVSKRVMSPKQFDRVFSVIVDPDEFEIDEEATSRTPIGRQALTALIKQGEVTSVPASAAERFLHAQSNAGEPLRLRSRDRSAGDMAFERYFVIVEPAFGAR